MPAGENSTTPTRLTEVAAVSLAAGAAAVLFSIAGGEILLGIALACYLLAYGRAPRPRFEWPSIWIPLALYMVWTILSMLFSPPMAHHFPQIKKMYVLAILPVGYAALGPAWFREPRALARWTVRAVVTTAFLSSLAGIVQFVQKYRHWQAKHQDFYDNYQLDRIGGFNGAGHWMAFSGQMMLVLMLAGAFLLAKHARPRAKWEIAMAVFFAAVISVGLLLSFTRGAWLGAALGTAYLLWHYKRMLIPVLPLVALGGYFAAPDFLQERARSILENRADYSAGARRVMYRAGWSMIKAHPVFGVGPEGVQYEFDRYKPDAYIPLAWYGHLHSDYLQTAASRGLPALAFLLWFFALAIRDQHRLASGPTSNAASNAWLARGATAATIAYYVEGAFEYNFGGSQVVMLWLFLLVLGYAARTESPEC